MVAIGSAYTLVLSKNIRMKMAIENTVPEIM